MKHCPLLCAGVVPASGGAPHGGQRGEKVPGGAVGQSGGRESEPRHSSGTALLRHTARHTRHQKQGQR